MISAPCATNLSPCSTAACTSRNWQPSEKESGVRLTMPITMAGRGKVNLKFLALRGFHEDQFRPARRFVPPQLLQAEHFFVKFYRSLEIIDPIPRVQEFLGLVHAAKVSVMGCGLSTR